MSNGAPGPDTILRPLLLAAVGSGVLALSLLQFSVDALPLLDAEGKLLIARSIRTAFFGFLGGSAALLVAYLTATWKSERLSFAFNLYGAIAFVGGATLAGGQVGGALRIMTGENGSPPLSVALFLLFNVAAVVLLGMAALVSAVRSGRFRPNSIPSSDTQGA
jgi:hypothetical protein